MGTLFARPDIRAGLITFGIGLGVEIIWGRSMLEITNQVLGFSPNEIPPLSIIALFWGTAIVGYVIPGVLGIVYGWLYWRGNPTIEVKRVALGGAIIGGITTLAYSLMVLTPDLMTGQTVEGSSLGVTTGICIRTVFCTGLGAAGAAIYTAIARRNQPVSPTPV